MTMTVAEALTRTQDDYLDDPDDDRWTDAEIKRHLDFALDNTYQEYLIAGGTFFDETQDGLSLANGSVDLSTYSPGQVRSVSVKYGTRFFKISPADVQDRQYDDDEVSRTVSVVFSRQPQVGSGTTTNPLVADAADNQLRSWKAFEELVCVRAAITASAKDGRVPNALKDIETMLLRNVMRKVNKPRRKRMPGPGNIYGQFLRWYYDEESQTLKMFRKLVVR